jgi:hypothetical protein
VIIVPNQVDYNQFCTRPLHGVQLEVGGSNSDNLIETKDTVETLKIWHNQVPSADMANLIWKKYEGGIRYQSLLRIYRTYYGLLFKIDSEGKGIFEYSRGGIGINWEKQGTGADHYFQSLGLSLWLELKGVPCIHANSVAVGNEAIGIMAPSRIGKTTLTAALVDSGQKMMSDDMIALHYQAGEWRVYPGWPQLRMWPDIALRYSGKNPEQLNQVHSRFEKRIIDQNTNKKFKFCRCSRPLRKIYLLDRRDSSEAQIDIQDISPSKALIHLLQNSILGDAYDALKIEQKRLFVLARIINQIPLKKISYPSGISFLPMVCEKIMDDLSMSK